MYKYSIIIPVYNAEKTLDRCIDSLVSQNYTDVQIILVNDGSSDRSADICQAWSKRCPQITYFYQQNSGVSSARNKGLELACGKYVLFVDSDDYVSNDYFTTLDVLDQEYDWDLIMFSYIKTKGQCNTLRDLGNFSSNAYNLVVRRLSESYYRKTLTTLWNKRFRLDLIQSRGIRFNTKLSVAEDKLFSLEYAMHCQSLRIIADPLYYVNLENENSLSRKLRDDHEVQSRIFQNEVDRLLQSCADQTVFYEHFRAADNFFKYRSVYASAKRMHLRSKPMIYRITEIRKMCDAVNREKMTLPDSRYCKLLSLPVKLRLAFLIDLVGRKLATR